MGLIYGILLMLGFEALTGYGPVGYVREVLRILRDERPDGAVDAARQAAHVAFSPDEDPTRARGPVLPTDLSFEELNARREDIRVDSFRCSDCHARPGEPHKDVPHPVSDIRAGMGYRG